jgi:uncharacterized metal-binding protein YceD (DUF177 family)
MTEVPFLSRPVEVAKIGSGETIVTTEASAEERAALASALGLVDIVGLSSEIVLTRGSAGMIRVDGWVKADIVQSCVVSLEPVPQRIDEAISRRFVEGAPRPASAKQAAEVKVEVIEEEEPPDLLAGPLIDVGVIIVEHFVLAIDPYPRALGAALPGGLSEDAGDAGDSPFAVLAKIRGTGSKSG